MNGFMSGVLNDPIVPSAAIVTRFVTRRRSGRRVPVIRVRLILKQFTEY